MQVFNFEQSVTDFAAALPHEGALFYSSQFFSHPGIWGALVWVILALIIFRENLRGAIFPAIVAGIAAGIGDLTSRRIVKALVMRPRPRFVHEICDHAYCWGFVSSHATNVAAAMTVLCLYNRKNIWFAVPIVLLVSASRIYLQDHYLLDVVGGMALGFIIGLSLYKIALGLMPILRAKFSRIGQPRSY